MSQGGISNRIKCLISSMKLAEKTNRDLIVYWPKDEACNCNFSDLFENEIKGVSKEELKKIILNKNYELYQNYFNKMKKEFVLVDSSRFEGFSQEDIQLKFEKTSREVVKEILSYLNKLKVKKEILIQVNKFIKKKFSKNMIGIHIRRGDFVKLSIADISPDEKFIEEMKKEIEKNKNVKFFLATEDKNTEKVFRKIFLKKIITFPKKTSKREDEGSVEEALIELIILSKCDKLIGSYGSTFTEMAWFFGGCKQPIKIVIDKQILKEYLSSKEKRKGFFNKIKKVIYELITPVDIRLLDRK
jgi:hypothetical protein